MAVQTISKDVTLNRNSYIKSSKGSHHKFIKAGLNRPFILAKHHPIDPAAINEILDFVNKEYNK